MSEKYPRRPARRPRVAGRSQRRTTSTGPHTTLADDPRPRPVGSAAPQTPESHPEIPSTVRPFRPSPVPRTESDASYDLVGAAAGHQECDSAGTPRHAVRDSTPPDVPGAQPTDTTSASATAMPGAADSDAIPVEESRTAETEAAETGAVPVDTRARRRNPARRVLVGVLGILVLVAAALTGYLATRPVPADVHPALGNDGTYTPGTIPSADGAAAVSAATHAVPVVLSYDFRTLDKGLADAKGQLTPSFAATFEKTFNATARPMATGKHAVTNALVRGAGVVGTPSSDEAKVLVYLDQILVSSDTMKDQNNPAKVSQDRVLVDLHRAGDQWQVNDISPF